MSLQDMWRLGMPMWSIVSDQDYLLLKSVAVIVGGLSIYYFAAWFYSKEHKR